MTDHRDALLLVDLQNAFFDDPGLAKQREALIAAANRLSRAARAADIPVFVVTTVHSRDGSTWTLNMLEVGEGYLFNGDEGTEVVSGLDTCQTTRVEKTRDSAWFATDLHLRLTNLNVNRIVLAGVSTHGCIGQTARDAYAYNLSTVIVTDAVADARVDHHREQISHLTHDRQASLVTLTEMLDEWADDNTFHHSAQK